MFLFAVPCCGFCLFEIIQFKLLFQDLKEYISKAGEVTFADAHKRKQGEGLVTETNFSFSFQLTC